MIKVFADERFPKFNNLSPLSIEEAIQFEEGFIEYWSSEDELENLHYSPVLKNCSTTYEFLNEYSKLQHDED